jgi:hypothetical protein
MAENKGSRLSQMTSRTAFSLVLGGIALALFLWPIMRTPPPEPIVSYPFLFVAWDLVIIALLLTPRITSPRSRRRLDAGNRDA